MVCDLLVLLASRHETEHLDLALTQLRDQAGYDGVACRPLRRASAGRHEGARQAGRVRAGGTPEARTGSERCAAMSALTTAVSR